MFRKNGTNKILRPSKTWKEDDNMHNDFTRRTPNKEHG